VSRLIDVPDQLAENEPLPLERILVAEVNQVADRLTGDAHVIQELSLMLGGKFDNRFEFYHETAKDKQIRHIAFLELPSLIKAFELRLGVKVESPQFQLNLQAFLIDLLC
jgi:hypothetical protein